jgi:hypothetical protein
MTDAAATFVQFPHPGAEHNPASDDMPWNVDAHRRKFLLAPGHYIDADDHVGEADLVFWGEWEPPSRIERRWPANGRLPRALHRPYWSRPATRGFRQNTDPWVWGERMLYSNCKQTFGPERRRTCMQELRAGSVICFGSTIDGEFCLDTVLVVECAQPWSPGEIASLDVDEAFRTCTGDPIAAGCTGTDAELTLYRGATADDPVEGMFSFVPAMRADAQDARFARPPLRIPGLINPANRQSTWGAKRPLPPRTVQEAWCAVRHQVLAAGLLLAVRLPTPPKRAEDAELPAGARERC